MLKSEFTKKEAANRRANRYAESLRSSPEFVQDPSTNPYLYMKSAIEVVKSKLQSIEITNEKIDEVQTRERQEQILLQQNRFLRNNLKSMNDNISVLISKLSQEDEKVKRNALNQGHYSVMINSQPGKPRALNTLKSRFSAEETAEQIPLELLAEKEQEIDQKKIEYLVREKLRVQERLEELSHPDFMKNLLLMKEKTDRQILQQQKLKIRLKEDQLRRERRLRQLEKQAATCDDQTDVQEHLSRLSQMADKNEQVESDNQKARVFVNQLAKKLQQLERQYAKLERASEKLGIDPEQVKQVQLQELQAQDNLEQRQYKKRMLKMTLENLKTRQQNEFKEKSNQLKGNTQRKDEIFTLFNQVLQQLGNKGLEIRDLILMARKEGDEGLNEILDKWWAANEQFIERYPQGYQMTREEFDALVAAALENFKEQEEEPISSPKAGKVQADLKKRELDPREQKRKEAQDAIDQVRRRRAEIEEKIANAQRKKQIEAEKRKKAAIAFIENQRREQEAARQALLLKEEEERRQRRKTAEEQKAQMAAKRKALEEQKAKLAADKQKQAQAKRQANGPGLLHKQKSAPPQRTKQLNEELRQEEARIQEERDSEEEDSYTNETSEEGYGTSTTMINNGKNRGSEISTPVGFVNKIDNQTYKSALQPEHQDSIDQTPQHLQPKKQKTSINESVQNLWLLGAVVPNESQNEPQQELMQVEEPLRQTESSAIGRVLRQETQITNEYEPTQENVAESSMSNTKSDIQTQRSVLNQQHLQVDDQGPIQVDEAATDGEQEEKIETDTEYSMPVTIVTTSHANPEEPQAQEVADEVKSFVTQIDRANFLNIFMCQQKLIKINCFYNFCHTYATKSTGTRFFVQNGPLLANQLAGNSKQSIR